MPSLNCYPGLKQAEDLAVNGKLSVLKKLAYELSRLLSALYRDWWIICTFVKIGNHLLSKNFRCRLQHY